MEETTGTQMCVCVCVFVKEEKKSDPPSARITFTVRKSAGGEVEQKGGDARREENKTGA